MVNCILLPLQVHLLLGSSHRNTDNGELFTWGNNSEGQLGLGPLEHTFVPQRADFTKNEDFEIAVSDVDCGERHTIVLSTKGDVFAMGCNEVGQLGTGSGSPQTIVYPKLVDIDTRIRKVAAGISHTLLLTQHGRIYASGDNNGSQLGTGNKAASKVFIEVATGKGITFKKVSAGGHSAAFCEKGALYLWGSGIFGEYQKPTLVGELKFPLKRLAVGHCSGCAIDSKGAMYTWGSNQRGELGTGDAEPRLSPQQIISLRDKRMTSVACGANFVVALGNTLSVEGVYQSKVIQAPVEKDFRISDMPRSGGSAGKSNWQVSKSRSKTRKESQEKVNDPSESVKKASQVQRNALETSLEHSVKKQSYAYERVVSNDAEPSTKTRSDTTKMRDNAGYYAEVKSGNNIARTSMSRTCTYDEVLELNRTEITALEDTVEELKGQIIAQKQAVLYERAAQHELYNTRINEMEICFKDLQEVMI